MPCRPLSLSSRPFRTATTCTAAPMILSSRPDPSFSTSHFDHSSSSGWKTLTTASKSSLGNASSSLSSHAHNIPTITLEARPASRVKPRASSSPPVPTPSSDVPPCYWRTADCKKDDIEVEGQGLMLLEDEGVTDEVNLQSSPTSPTTRLPQTHPVQRQQWYVSHFPTASISLNTDTSRHFRAPPRLTAAASTFSWTRPRSWSSQMPSHLSGFHPIPQPSSPHSSAKSLHRPAILIPQKPSSP